METSEQRAKRIFAQLAQKYPSKNAFAMSEENLHFACEIDPATNHPEYDKCIEVLIKSKPHFHREMIQRYTILSGTLELHVKNKVIILNEGDTYIVKPNTVHWAKAIDCECWYEIYSTPGWTPEDHILVEE